MTGHKRKKKKKKETNGSVYRVDAQLKIDNHGPFVRNAVKITFP